MKTFTTLISMIFIGFAFAETIKVPGDFTTIQEAINAAKDGDVVLVDEGIYYENINFKGKAITVASHFYLDGDTSHISQTKIDGSQSTNPDSGSVVSFISGEDTMSVLSGFTITGGTGTKTSWLDDDLVCGGGIFGYGGTATIKNNHIINNNINASGGGAGISFIDTLHTYAIVENNTIEFNSVNVSDFAAGGGILFWNCSGSINNNNAISNNSVISENVEAKGGGIFLGRDRPIAPMVYIENNIITNNYCKGKDVAGEPGGQGGGLHSLGVNAIIRMNKIIGNKTSGSNFSGGAGIVMGDIKDITRIDANEIAFNRALKEPGNGGGLNIFAGNPRIVNNLIHNNQAANGAGIFLWSGGNADIINNTITNNKGNFTGAGIYAYNSTPVILNTIIWENQPTIMQVFQEESINELTIAYSNVQGGWQGEGNMDVDPLFANEQFYLDKKSPLGGKGIDRTYQNEKWYSAPKTDKEGYPRAIPFLTYPDMGAFESRIGADRIKTTIWVPYDFKKIQDAIDKAKNSDTVLVADGEYFENINFIGKAISVASQFLVDRDTSHISQTIIDGSKSENPDSGSVVYFISGEDTTSVLTGFTITGGTGTNTYIHNKMLRYGAGIHGNKGTAKIEFNRIVNNTINTSGGAAGILFTDTELRYAVVENNQIKFNIVDGPGNTFSGGIEFWNCAGRITNNQISNNSVISDTGQAFGGGMFIGKSILVRPDVMIENNLIKHNYSEGIDKWSQTFLNPGALGGGVYLQGSNVILIKNKIIYNKISGASNPDGTGLGHAGGAGLSISRITNNSRIDGNEISNNEVTIGTGYGGAVYLYEANPIIVNNIIQNNAAKEGGGCYFFSNSNAELINNTIVNNEADDGGGLFVKSDCEPVIINSIIYDNLAKRNANISTGLGTKINVVYSDIQGGWQGEGNIDVDPFFVDGTFSLSDSSKCIGKGIQSITLNNTTYSCSPNCYLGHSRPLPAGTNPDIGACESHLSEPTDIEIISQIPKNFFLKQNYPNPFNPSTTIEYQLSKQSKVDLTIYNILGQKVYTLVSKKQPAGNYKVELNATDFSSGVYFYRLETNQGFTQTKKLILMK